MAEQLFHPAHRSPRIDKIMPEDQFKQVVEAIVLGKYSWACVLILRFAGYNPLHYIPYTTYNRLVKENCNIKQRLQQPGAEKLPEDTVLSEGCLSQLQDLTYLELLDQKASHINGSSCNFAECLGFAIR